VARVHGLAGIDAATQGPRQHGRHRSAPPSGRRATEARPGQAADNGPADVFTRFAADYVAEHPGRPVTLLQAGCATAGPELDVPALLESAPELSISRVDDDDDAVRAVAATRPDLSAATFAELRTLAIAPRSVDLVQCSMLLHRVRNAELVLDRLVAALRPGGLLFLRTADRETAAGFLDRRLPQFARVLSWQAAQPGQPGPFPACYEPIASGRGIEAFVVKRGLAIAHRQICSGQICSGTGGPDPAPRIPPSQLLVAWLSRGRLTASHDELRYVIRKPEDRYARILSR
jgi:SAM-dependent methyltransferase